MCIFLIVIFVIQVDSGDDDQVGAKSDGRASSSETSEKSTGGGQPANPEQGCSTGSSSGGGGDDPRRPNRNSNLHTAPADADEEESDEEVEDDDGARGGELPDLDENPEGNVLGDLDVDGVEDGDDASDNQSVVESSNPGSVLGDPAPIAGANSGTMEGKDKWLSYKELMATTYPAKSQKLYLAAFCSLEKYLKGCGAYDPNVAPDQLSLMNYFHHLRHDLKWAATTLWSHFSRVNAVMKRTWGVNLTIYPRLTDLLKGYEAGQRVKKSSVFSPQQE